MGDGRIQPRFQFVLWAPNKVPLLLTLKHVKLWLLGNLNNRQPSDFTIWRGDQYARSNIISGPSMSAVRESDTLFTATICSTRNVNTLDHPTKSRTVKRNNNYRKGFGVWFSFQPPYAEVGADLAAIREFFLDFLMCLPYVQLQLRNADAHPVPHDSLILKEVVLDRNLMELVPLVSFELLPLICNYEARVAQRLAAFTQLGQAFVGVAPPPPPGLAVDASLSIDDYEITDVDEIFDFAAPPLQVQSPPLVPFMSGHFLPPPPVYYDALAASSNSGGGGASSSNTASLDRIKDDFRASNAKYIHDLLDMESAVTEELGTPVTPALFIAAYTKRARIYFNTFMESLNTNPGNGAEDPIAAGQDEPVQIGQGGEPVQIDQNPISGSSVLGKRNHEDA